MSDADRHLLCPYCGEVQPVAPRCRQCGGLFEALSRDATQTTMGPWFVRDPQQPFLPGCSYEVIVRRAQGGRIRPDSIVRGPTTRQWWTFARHAPGVAHLLGLCHRCGRQVDPLGSSCEACGTLFVRPMQRNELGLQYPTAQAAAEAQRQIREKRQRLQEDAAAAPSPIALGEPLEVDPDEGRHRATSPSAITALARDTTPPSPPRPESPPTRAGARPPAVQVNHAMRMFAALAQPQAGGADDGRTLRQFVSALDVEMAAGEATSSAIQPTGRGMRVRAPGASVAHGLWLSVGIAAGILVLGILLLVVTHT